MTLMHSGGLRNRSKWIELASLISPESPLTKHGLLWGIPGGIRVRQPLYSSYSHTLFPVAWKGKKVDCICIRNNRVSPVTLTSPSRTRTFPHCPPACLFWHSFLQKRKQTWANPPCGQAKKLMPKKLTEMQQVGVLFCTLHFHRHQVCSIPGVQNPQTADSGWLIWGRAVQLQTKGFPLVCTICFFSSCP